MDTFLSREKTEQWLLSVNSPQMGQLFRFGVSAYESQPAVAIGTYYVGMLNNLSLSLFLYVIKLSLSNLKNKKGPMTRDS